ncbi:unknown [Bacteroides sp. CAG:530]|nr:unknown [Bacteroides sp. CAG:530]
MLFCYTLVSGVENCLINPSHIASGADFLHLKIDKKRMQCFIQTIAFFHLTIRILQCCNSHSFLRALRDFLYVFYV